MSREHAVLKADPNTGVSHGPSLGVAVDQLRKDVYIEDVGSMHGTYVDDHRIIAHERHPLYDDDIVKFGSEVTRGPGM